MPTVPEISFAFGLTSGLLTLGILFFVYLLIEAFFLWVAGEIVVGRRVTYGESIRIAFFGTIAVDQNQSIICIVGNKLSEKKTVLREVFDSLEKIDVRMVSYGGSHNNISILVETPQKEKALNKLNEGLFHLG